MNTVKTHHPAQAPASAYFGVMPSMDKFRVNSIGKGKIGFFSHLFHPKKAKLMEKELEAMRFFGIKPATSNPSLAYHEYSKQILNHDPTNAWVAKGYESTAIRVKPNEAKYWNGLGIIKCIDPEQIQNLSDDGKRELILDAIRDFGKATKLNPKFADAHNNWGNALRILKKYQEALEHYNAAIALDPHTDEFYRNRARTLIKLGRKEEAQHDINTYESMSGRPFMPSERISGTAISPDGSTIENHSLPMHTLRTRPSD